MTTRRMFGLGTAAAVAALLVITQDASAFGKRKRGCDAPSCDTACAAPACDTPCASAVSYVDQQVTCYKTEWKTKKVDVDVCEAKWVDVEYKYTVCEPVVTKQTVKVCEMVQTKQQYKYMVNTTVADKVKVKVCQNTWTEQDQKYTYCEPVWGKTKVMRTVCETVCVPTQVACAPPAPACDSGCGSSAKRKGLFSRLCHKPSCDDPCPAPCPTACAAPCEPCVQTVMVRQVVQKQVECEVATCTMVQKEGVRKVRVCTPTWVEQDSVVYRCVPVEQVGERMVCTPTWVDREVPVTRMVPVEKVGTRRVCQPVMVKKSMDVSYCERVPYTTTIRVPVAAPCAPCAAPVQCCN